MKLVRNSTIEGNKLRAGFPIFALEGNSLVTELDASEHLASMGRLLDLHRRKTGIWTKPLQVRPGFVLLFRPVWPGFAVNTLLYAVVAWVLACGPFALRRFIRVKRGLCPKCAYPVGESWVCSACGREEGHLFRSPRKSETAPNCPTFDRACSAGVRLPCQLLKGGQRHRGNVSRNSIHAFRPQIDECTLLDCYRRRHL